MQSRRTIDPGEGEGHVRYLRDHICCAFFGKTRFLGPFGHKWPRMMFCTKILVLSDLKNWTFLDCDRTLSWSVLLICSKRIYRKTSQHFGWCPGSGRLTATVALSSHDQSSPNHWPIDNPSKNLHHTAAASKMAVCCVCVVLGIKEMAKRCAVGQSIPPVVANAGPEHGLCVLRLPLLLTYTNTTHRAGTNLTALKHHFLSVLPIAVCLTWACVYTVSR